MSETAPEAPSAPQSRSSLPSASPPSPTLIELFTAFAAISLAGFGGVLAWSRRMMVEERKWMTADEFNDLYALCNFLPGPNIVNFSVVFGRRFGGIPGAVVALLGLLGPPFGIVMAIAVFYASYGTIEVLQRMFATMAAAAAGLTISASLKMLAPLMRERVGAPHAMALAAFAAVGVLRWPLYGVLAVLIPLSIALAWWARR
jgi:chromate transporter